MDVDAVVQVLAEAPRPDLRLEVAVGGGHDPRLHRNGAGRAQPGDPPLLQHPEQLGLRGERQLADLVEEQRARAPAASNAPFRVALAPVNAPRSWPNSSLSTSCSGSAAQLMATNGAVGTRPEPVQLPGHELLPVPLSPTISTVLGTGATRAICSRSRRSPRWSPTSEDSPSSRRRSAAHLRQQPAPLERELDLPHHPLHRLRLVDESVAPSRTAWMQRS